VLNLPPDADAPSAESSVSRPSPASGKGAHSLSAQRSGELEAIFAADGLFARALDNYCSRVAQIEMARAVAATLEATTHPIEPDIFELRKRPARGASTGLAAVDGEGGQQYADDTLIVEAGTGTGKTYAYLVPAMLWGGKVIISTGTKHLQDQLFQRDIPTVRDALAVPVTVAMLKGRANYLCHYYLQRTTDQGHLPSRQDAAYLREIIQFAKITQSGDKAELASVPETAPIWAQVTSTRDNCLGQECSYYKDCFVMRARRDAQQADVVVVNHHLFFADIMLRDTSMAELLPSANTIIFDEAHQLPETATFFFGETLSTTQIIELARDVIAEGLSHARDAVEWVALGGALERAARQIRLAFGVNAATRVAVYQLAADHPLFAALDGLQTSLDAVATALSGQAERAESLGACLRRARALQQILAGWVAVGAPCVSAPAPEPECEESKKVRWLEVFSHTVQLHETPLSIAPIFAKQRASARRAWIFTSATLSVRGDFTHYAAQMGLDARRSLALASPFDYQAQGLLYVPRDLPQPASPAFTDAVFDAALPVIEAAAGGVFMLCTTLRAVDRFAAKLREVIATRGWSMPLLVQGDASRTELLDRFRAYGNAVLVGSQSFWEGVDVRGDALSLVVIDKLPFAAPDDPVLSARLDALAKKGLSPFAVHQLPQAVIALKQGAGRLIRAETDRGVLMICDTRLIDKPYGRRIWQSLPPFKRTRELSTVQAFFTERQTRIAS